MKRQSLLLGLAIVASTVVVPLSASAQTSPNVLVWGGAYGFRHPSITTAELAFVELAETTGAFSATVTENPLDLSGANLRNYDMLAWISTTGKPPLTQTQRDEIIRWAYCGGGTLGFHAMADSNYGWAEHAELIGAQFDSHPKNAGSGEARMLVEDRTHPITEGWHDVESFLFDDEYYRWRGTQSLPDIDLPRSLPDTNVLLSLDETSIEDEIQNGPIAYAHHQPIAWTKTFRGGGRVYYNNMGHSDSTWGLAEFRTSIVNGVDWVSQVRPDLDCVDGDGEIPSGAVPAAPEPATVGLPCTPITYSERSGGTWQNSGPPKILTPAGDTQALAAGIVGGLSWGAQFYVLDLSEAAASTATITFDLSIPNPADDYDLSVTTAWGWYGSQADNGATSEQIVIEDVPHCAILQAYGENLRALSGQGPTLVVTVAADDPVETVPDTEAAPDPDPEPMPATGGPGPMLLIALVALGALLVLRGRVLGRDGGHPPGLA